MSKVKSQPLIYLLVEIQTCWLVLEHNKATAPCMMRKKAWKSRAYLVLDKPSRYTRIRTGVLWHSRSQTRPESYRIYLICYNIRRRSTKGVTFRANGSGQDIGNATVVDNKFHASAGLGDRGMQSACLRLSSAKARRDLSLCRSIASSTLKSGPCFRGSRAAILASISACWSRRALMVGSREESWAGLEAEAEV